MNLRGKYNPEFKIKKISAIRENPINTVSTDQVFYATGDARVWYRLALTDELMRFL
ncbi:MAG: hypothetical protein KA715_08750 [Xanthomonadaceae bacterium]|nr:hypothetical protein [Xanthomonadaceae bacterium]